MKAALDWRPTGDDAAGPDLPVSATTLRQRNPGPGLFLVGHLPRAVQRILGPLRLPSLWGIEL
jgi:hypothetical protein